MKKIILSLSLLFIFVQADLNILVIDKKDSSEQSLCRKNLDTQSIQQRGCCSHHGGVSGCSNGKIVCNDGTYSPSCTCAIPLNPLG
ncbi:MAG: hypothetical protein NTW78_02270 [Campylobacterales bacterium]|nr:hypothetical protein [Campylobacterales bacterium]